MNLPQIPKRAVSHYKALQRMQLAGLRLARRSWRQIDSTRIRQSWNSEVTNLAIALSVIQVRAATAGASYGASTLAEQGLYVPPERFVNPQAFGGVASDGRDLAQLLREPQIGTLSMIKRGLPVQAAVASGLVMLERIVRTQVSDAARGASSVDITVRQKVGYVRMLNPPSCSRCVILAGKYYGWNTGFKRHPNCDCVHVPSTEAIAGDRVIDPYEYFNSLSEVEQNRLFGRDSAQAIRDGADIYQVENAKRGRAADLRTTTEGTTRRGAYGRPGRLTPDGIYEIATSREHAIELLEKYGYILPGGQMPGGVILGNAARSAGSGVTAAQQRLETARLRYQAVREGRNPFGSGPLTPEIAARVENDYRHWLTTGGQIYI